MCARLAGHRTTVDVTEDSTHERQEAIALIQDDTGRGYFIDDDDIVRAAHATRLVRRHFPDGQNITGPEGSTIQIMLSDSAACLLQNRLTVGWLGDTALRILNLSAPDSVNSALGVSMVSVMTSALMQHQVWFMRPSFRHPIYRLAVTTQYNDLRDVDFAICGMTGGSGSGLTLV